MPSNQPETPTPDALDAAVGSFVKQLRSQVACIEDCADLDIAVVMGQRDEHERLVQALIAAVEARAVARERARECAWTQRGTASWDTQCGEYIIATFRSKRCDNCGGRVRVDAP
jgi:hypothetical protein